MAGGFQDLIVLGTSGEALTPYAQLDQKNMMFFKCFHVLANEQLQPSPPKIVGTAGVGLHTITMQIWHDIP